MSKDNDKEKVLIFAKSLNRVNSETAQSRNMHNIKNVISVPQLGDISRYEACKTLHFTLNQDPAKYFFKGDHFLDSVT